MREPSPPAAARDWEDLRAANERLSAIFNGVRDAIFIADVETGLLVDVNEEAERLVGRSRAELIGMHHSALHPAGDREHYRARFRQRASEPRPINKDAAVETADGRIVPVEVSAKAITLADGRRALVGVFRDVREQRRLQALRAARLRLVEYSLGHSTMELLVATLDETEALTGSQVGFYHFLDPDQRTIRLQAWSTRTAREMCRADGVGQHYPVDQAGVWVDCVHQRRPVIHNDYAALPHRKGLPDGHAPVVRELVVPVFRGDLIVAILGVGNKATAYDDEDIATISQFADLAWDLAERTRAEEALRASRSELKALSRQLVLLQETSSRDLARELHDSVGQNLTALNLNLTRLADQGRLADAARPLVEDSLRLVVDAMRHVRDVMADLRPPVLEDYGLGAALRWYGGLFASRTGLKVTVSFDDDEVRCGPDTETALFRIAQEAMTNVARHARARAVDVSLTPVGREWRLTVTDDGDGFDPAVPARVGTWGLLTMRERAELVGGRVSVVSQPGRGTSVTIHVPAPEAGAGS